MKRRPRESDSDAAKRIVLKRRASFIAAAIASSSMATACACLKVKPDVEPDAGASGSTPTATPPGEETTPAPCLKIAPAEKPEKPDASTPDASPPRPCLKPPNATPSRNDDR